MLDFAGGTVVHINAGIAGLVCCIVLGKRIGYGNEHMAPHNLTLTLIGTSLLWVGWFGFNAGSALAADGRAGMAFAVDPHRRGRGGRGLDAGGVDRQGQASACSASPRAPSPAWSRSPRPPASSCRAAALVIGLAAGIVCYWARDLLKHMLGYDDSLDVFGVHGVGGIVGALLTGVFASRTVGGDAARGLLDGNPAQLWIQLKGMLWTIGWCAVASLRDPQGCSIWSWACGSTRDSEREGLDLALHGESVA